jgi:hypothetical protein
MDLQLSIHKWYQSGDLDAYIARFYCCESSIDRPKILIYDLAMLRFTTPSEIIIYRINGIQKRVESFYNSLTMALVKTIDFADIQLPLDTRGIIIKPAIREDMTYWFYIGALDVRVMVTTESLYRVINQLRTFLIDSRFTEFGEYDENIKMIRKCEKERSPLIESRKIEDSEMDSFILI